MGEHADAPPDAHWPAAHRTGSAVPPEQALPALQPVQLRPLAELWPGGQFAEHTLPDVPAVPAATV